MVIQTLQNKTKPVNSRCLPAKKHKNNNKNTKHLETQELRNKGSKGCRFKIQVD